MKNYLTCGVFVILFVLIVPLTSLITSDPREQFLWGVAGVVGLVMGFLAKG